MNSDYDEIQQEIIKKAETKALAILNYMDRTEFQLREKLKEGEFPPFAIEEAVEYVRSFHYIDDERYAENFIRRRKEEKSLFELRMELKKRGVEESDIDTALLNEPVDEKEAVKALFCKKYGRMDLTDRKVYEKALRYFSGKGFSYENIRHGIEEALNSN